MATDVIGTYNFSEVPQVNGVPLPTGGGTNILQVVTGTIASASGTTTVPLDNTIPTNTEGWQFFSQAFTPLSATSKIIIHFTISGSHSTTTTTPVASVFVGTTNIGSTAISMGSARAMIMSRTIVYQPGNTNAITFVGRIGAQAGTVYVNNIGGTTLGGSLVSNYTIYEVE